MPSEYLFLSSPLPSMQEGLRYAPRNLDGSNFNPAGLREILEPVTRAMLATVTVRLAERQD